MSKGGYLDFMIPGVNVCEAKDVRCRKRSVGEFKRDPKELKVGRDGGSWDEDMPISLCAEHAGDRVPLTKNQIDKLTIKFFN